MTSAPMASPAAADAGTPPEDDHAVLHHTLELAATRCEDLTPLVFQRFFERRPDAASLFTVPDPNAPPLGCGQMLYEIICLLGDAATGQSYIGSYLHDIAEDHKRYAVFDASLYADFLAALVDVLAGLLGADWQPAHAAAWQRQSAQLLQHLPELAARHPHSAGCPVKHGPA